MNSRKSRRSGDTEEEGQSCKQQRQLTTAEAQRTREQLEAGAEEDDGWEDASDSAESHDSDVDERFDEMDDGEIVQDDEGDDEYADFQREAGQELAEGLRSITFQNPPPADETEPETMVWRRDQGDGLDGNGELAYSNKAYDSFFQLRTEYPALSFDILHDTEGANRTRYPLTMYMVAGSQADERNKNQLYVLKVHNICRTKHDVESDDESDADSYIGGDGDSSEDGAADEEEGAGDHNEAEINNGEPLVDYRVIKHAGTANRVRCSRHNTNLVAVWSDIGAVQIFNVLNDFRAIADFANWSKEQAKGFHKKDKVNPLQFSTPMDSHKTEGYAVDWSAVRENVFASGDCNGDIFVWQPTDDGRWAASSSSRDTQGHHSVEEINWSPIQPDVLICGRAGGMVEVWDTRDMRKSQLSWRADPSDINVCSWNRAKQASHLLVTGADSSMVSVWDLRKSKDATPTPIQQLQWHAGPITSVEFSHHNESVLSVTGDDGQCTLWDLSLERDPSEEKEVVGELFGRQDLVQIPDQLMFQHQGLLHPKEAHWHAQIPGMLVTTDFNGLHLFKPMNWRSLMK